MISLRGYTQKVARANTCATALHTRTGASCCAGACAGPCAGPYAGSCASRGPWQAACHASQRVQHAVGHVVKHHAGANQDLLKVLAGRGRCRERLRRRAAGATALQGGSDLSSTREHRQRGHMPGHSVAAEHLPNA